MKVFILSFIFLLSCSKELSSVQLLKSDQFASEEVEYLSNVHTGFYQYGAKSLYNTGDIVLTFDDGPNPKTTPRVLDLLKKYNVKASFFILGSKVKKSNQHIVERILKEGHILASHDWDHNSNNSENAQKFESDLKKSLLLIEKIKKKLGIKINEMYFRFPYGAYGKAPSYHHFEILKDLGLKMYGDNCLNFAFWDIDTVDWLGDMKAKDIANNIISQVKGGKAFKHVKKNGKFVKESYYISKPKGGGVVLMHDIHERTVQGLENFLEKVKGLDIRVVPLNEVEEFHYANKYCSILDKGHY